MNRTVDQIENIRTRKTSLSFYKNFIKTIVTTRKHGKTTRLSVFWKRQLPGQKMWTAFI